MKLMIEGFWAGADPAVIARGRDLAAGGAVTSIERVEDGYYEAEVAGTDWYDVTVELKENGQVRDAYCDCPYDYGPICKHIVAVLIKLQERQAALEGPVHRSNDGAKNTLAELLRQQSKEKLEELLLYLAQESVQTREVIRLRLARSEDAQELEIARNLIRSSVRHVQDRRGYVDWRQAGHAISGIQEVLGQARELRMDWELTRAAKLDLLCIEEAIDMMEYVDDSNGVVGGPVEEALAEIVLIAESVDDSPHGGDDRKTILAFCMEEVIKDGYDDWTEWQLVLLESIVEMVRTPQEAEAVEALLQKLGEAKTTSMWSGTYWHSAVEQLRLRLLPLSGHGEDEASFIQSRLHLTEFREMAIERALQAGDLEAALRYAQEGERQAEEEGFAGRVTHWLEQQYQVYYLMEDLAKQRKIGERLLLAGHYSPYYEGLKQTYLADEWKRVVPGLLAQAKNGRYGVYTRLLVDEAQWGELLDHVKQFPDQIMSYCRHLIGYARADTIGLMGAYIERAAARASKRRDYAEVAGLIITLRGLGEPLAAQQMVQRLLEAYPRKPAFREELLRYDYLPG
ncbi:SWIM zinc finger family protein [Paenibacillus sp. 1P07SE]|uniref:SWIM zinc finger family protein n=1 Tax=Paenibacillus sp. 1P07SE TaxID=3132209 RepID=UPI0039A601B1